jgi:hypothetical protein
LIDLVTDKDRVAKAIKEINDARDEANAALAAVGTIKQIEKDGLAAAQDRTQAAESVTEARTQAAGIMKRAKAQSEKSLNACNAAAAHVKEREEAADRKERNVAAREKELQKAMDSAGRKLKTAEKLKGEADALTSEAERQLAIFKNAASRVQ